MCSCESTAVFLGSPFGRLLVLTHVLRSSLPSIANTTAGHFDLLRFGLTNSFFLSEVFTILLSQPFRTNLIICLKRACLSYSKDRRCCYVAAKGRQSPACSRVLERSRSKSEFLRIGASECLARRMATTMRQLYCSPPMEQLGCFLWAPCKARKAPNRATFLKHVFSNRRVVGLSSSSCYFLFQGRYSISKFHELFLGAFQGAQATYLLTHQVTSHNITQHGMGANMPVHGSSQWQSVDEYL